MYVKAGLLIYLYQVAARMQNYYESQHFVFCLSPYDHAALYTCGPNSCRLFTNCAKYIKFEFICSCN